MLSHVCTASQPVVEVSVLVVEWNNARIESVHARFGGGAVQGHDFNCWSCDVY